MQLIGHGIDLVTIAKYERMIQNQRYLDRCYTTGEQNQCNGKPEKYAARFAAKEAILKALKLGIVDGMSLKDVEVVFEPNGNPGVKLYGLPAIIAAEKGITGWILSFAHSGPQAVASAIAYA
ncbi:MAG TPA: holo-ACP synthase [Fimbriimonas sp.]|nr:holo-ACP synthase [Fimbriimonas sp.]